MAVQRTLKSLQLLSRASSSVGGSCSGPTVTPPCPCPPRPPPPCRKHEPGPKHGVRVVCCPPRPAKPPPCPPASCTLTCGDVTRKCHNIKQPQNNESLQQSDEQDCVAWRLQCAKRIRRLDYEREVAAPAKEPCPSCPSSPYTLCGLRHIAKATDGRFFEVAGPCPEKQRCSATGEPPPPQKVTLIASNSKCQIGNEHSDPCAHQTPVFLEIDRYSDKPPASSHKDDPSSSTSCCGKSKSSEGAAGTSGWCKDPPLFPGAPKRCRPLTIVERLRARPSGSATRKPPENGVRHFHTSVFTSSAAGGLQDILQAKKQLHKTGQGRVVVGDCSPHPYPPQPPNGKLDLCVMPGTSRVRVQVFLDGVDCKTGSDKSPNRNREAVGQPNNFISQCKGSESWLSHIQNKISRKSDVKDNNCTHGKKEPPCTPCPNPATVVPRGRRSECPPPSCAQPHPGHSKPQGPCGGSTRRTSSFILIANSLVPNSSY